MELSTLIGYVKELWPILTVAGGALAAGLWAVADRRYARSEDLEKHLDDLERSMCERLDTISRQLDNSRDRAAAHDNRIQELETTHRLHWEPIAEGMAAIHTLTASVARIETKLDDLGGRVTRLEAQADR